MGAPRSNRAKAVAAELRELVAALVEARRSLPRNGGWEGLAWQDEDDISAAELNVESAITVSRHKTPHWRLLAQRLDRSRAFLERVEPRRPVVKPIMERLKRLIDEASAA